MLRFLKWDPSGFCGIYCKLTITFIQIAFQRYESEYISHYKKFDAKRPNTVKGEVTRSLSYDSLSNGSTPRAGLSSIQLGTNLEPPLQRKRIVPYEKNHNIFKTLTVKEQADREWLRSNGQSRRSRSPNRRHKEVEMYNQVVWLSKFVSVISLLNKTESEI